MIVTEWSPDFELDYVRHTTRDELRRRHADHWRRFSADSITDALGFNTVIAEIGCGAAGGLLSCAPLSMRLVAIDPLIENYCDNGWLPNGLVLIPAFSHQLPLASISVDLAICIETLDHCENMDQFRKSQSELARILKPECRLLFMLPARSGPCDGHPCAPSSLEVVEAFNSCGLSVEKHNFPGEGTWLILKKR